MTPGEVLELLSKLGPLAREHGMESVELPGLTVKFRHSPPAALVPLKPKDTDPAKPRPSFAGRSEEEIRIALMEHGS